MPSFSSFAQTQRTAFFICPGGAIRQKLGLNSCHCNDASSECRVWESLHGGRQRYTAVDTFGLVLWGSQQQVFPKVKRTHSLSRWSSRWDKGCHGCICLLESIEVTAANGFSNLWWIAWDGCFKWFYDRNTQGFVLLKITIRGWTNFWLAQFSMEGWASTIGDYRLHHRSWYIAILNHLWIAYSLPLIRGGLGWSKKFTTPARIAIHLPDSVYRYLTNPRLSVFM